jgi:hypothetical protein
MSRRFQIHLVAMAAVLAASMQVTAQDFLAPAPRRGMIVGTVFDVNGDTVSGATVVLKGLDGNNGRTLVTSDNGFFSFQGVNSGIPYQVIISAKNFADWKSPTITLEPAQYKIISDIQLRIEVDTTVDVRYDSVQVATEQIRLEEKQRVFGVIPSF